MKLNSWGSLRVRVHLIAQKPLKTKMYSDPVITKAEMYSDPNFIRGSYLLVRFGAWIHMGFDKPVSQPL